MQMQRTKNATRNIYWGIIEKCIYLLLPFITRTVMIRVLGAEYIGLNSLFTSILQVLSISELGIGSAIVFSMYRPIAEGDNELLCALLNVYRRLYRIIGLVILAAGLVILPFIPRLITGDVPAGINVYILYLVYLANTVISYFLFAYKQALFKAHQRNDLISQRASIVYIFSNLLQIGLLFGTHNYYAYVIVVPLATLLTNLLNAYLANRLYPELKCRGKISSEMSRDIRKRVSGLVSYKVYGVIFNSVDTIVISAFLGLIPLAIYNNYYYVQYAIVGFITILTNSITAGVGNKMVTNNEDENYSDFKNFVFMNGWICGWCAVCLACLYQHFMAWWVGEDLLFPMGTMLLMVLYFLLPRITTMTFTYREAAGLWWQDRIRPLIAAVVNLTLNLILVRVIGMNGVILSTLVCTIFINVPWGSWILFKNYFKRSPRQYFGSILYYILITVVATVVTFIICSFLPSEGLGWLLVKLAICCVVPNLIFWLIYHKRSEFDYTKKIVRYMLSRFRRESRA